MAGNFVSVRLGPRLGIDTMIGGGTMIAAAAGVVMAAPGVGGRGVGGDGDRPDVLLRVRPRLGAAQRHGGRHRPVPAHGRAGGGGAASVQLTGSALYAIAVSHTYDGTLRPMTTAVATAGTPRS